MRRGLGVRRIMLKMRRGKLKGFGSGLEYVYGIVAMLRWGRGGSWAGLRWMD